MSSSLFLPYKTIKVLWPKRLNRTKVLPYALLLEDCRLTFISLVWIYTGEKSNQWKGLNRLDSLSTKHTEGIILERESEETNSLLTANEVADLFQIHISTVLILEYWKAATVGRVVKGYSRKKT